jgi:electron transfer flavoprotein alpha subunit
MRILVLLEQRDRHLKTAALEALTVAARLSGNQPANVAALLIGEGISGLAAQCKNYGASKVFCCDAPEFSAYQVLNYSAALTAAIREFSPDCVLGMATPLGKDLFARVAARLDAGLLTDLIAVDHDPQHGFIGGKKPLYAGKVIATVRYQGSALKMATLRPNVFAPLQSSGDATVVPFNCAVPASGLKVKEVKKGHATTVDLTEASRIISGGRALASKENFSILFDCAKVLGATVGASRAAVDSGYATHDMQVGQTGKTVNPSLYIACGISGSIQHMAGMRTAKVIVAVNTDVEAPIVGIADYAIIGDLFKVVPLLTKRLKEL